MALDDRHNACKGAKTDLERKSLLTCKLCASDMTAADDTYNHTFRSCQHPLLCQARAESGDLLLTVLLLTDLNRRLLPVLLRLSKHLVNRIDTLCAACQLAAYHTALSSTPEEDLVSLRTLQRRCLNFAPYYNLCSYGWFSTLFVAGIFRAYTPHGGKLSPTPLALALTSSDSSREKKPMSTPPSPRALEIPCLMTPLRSSSLTALLSQTAAQDGEFTFLSRA